MVLYSQETTRGELMLPYFVFCMQMILSNFIQQVYMDRVKRIWCLSPMRAASQGEPSDRKPDPWPLWMAGHAQLKFVMTECSKTQIRLTGLIYYWCILFPSVDQSSTCCFKRHICSIIICSCITYIEAWRINFWEYILEQLYWWFICIFLEHATFPTNYNILLKTVILVIQSRDIGLYKTSCCSC